MVDAGDLQLVPHDDAVQDRAQALMAKYRDMPMDLADATLVAAAEALGLTRVFTLDRDFTATSRQSRVSPARWISPMPPTPSGATIS